MFPQLGHPTDAPISNVSVTHVTASNTGDDSVALFNVESGGSVTNCQIRCCFSMPGPQFNLLEYTAGIRLPVAFYSGTPPTQISKGTSWLGAKCFTKRTSRQWLGVCGGGYFKHC